MHSASANFLPSRWRYRDKYRSLMNMGENPDQGGLVYVSLPEPCLMNVGCAQFWLSCSHFRRSSLGLWTRPRNLVTGDKILIPFFPLSLCYNFSFSYDIDTSVKFKLTGNYFISTGFFPSIFQHTSDFLNAKDPL